MRKKCLLLVFYVVLFVTEGVSQVGMKIDSLLAVLSDQKDDTSKVSILNAISKQFLLNKKVAEAKKYAADALELAKRKQYTTGISNSLISLGNIYLYEGSTFYYQGDYPQALKNYLSALGIFEENTAKRGIANARRNIGLVYWTQGDYSEAVKNHLASLKLFEEIQDKKAVAVAYNDLGNVFENKGDPKEALKNYLASLKLFEELGDKGGMINRYFNIGFLNDDLGNFDEALNNFSTALKIIEPTGDAGGIGACYNNIGDVYLHRARKQSDLSQRESGFRDALKRYQISLEHFRKAEDQEGLAVCYNSIGEVFIELKNYSKAREYLNAGLSLFRKVSSETAEERYQLPASYIRENYQMQARLDSATGNWQGAYNNHRLFIFYRDSLMSEENIRKITQVQMQYDFDKKEDSLRFQQQLTDEKLNEQKLLNRQQKLVKNYLIAGIILLFILAFVLYRNYRSRQQLKLESLRNKIAIDLHDDVGSTLSSISIFSQMAQQQSKEFIPLLDTIEESSRKMLDAMSDIVWSINPENDQFEKIILRMKSFAYELLGAQNIDFEFIADESISKMNVPMNVRKNIYLIFKEATNNMVKYAETNRAFFSLKTENRFLTLLIQDSGKGFDPDKTSTGNGLKNMRKRAGEIGAELIINSGELTGTTVKLNIAV